MSKTTTASARVAGVAGLCAAALLAPTGSASSQAASSSSAGSSPTFRTVVSGLNAPRGIAFDARGAMYVAESGKYLGPPPSTGQSSPVFGLSKTGKVTKYQRGTGKPVWSTGFTSFFANGEGEAAVLGPEGISAMGNSCSTEPADDDDRSPMIRRGSHDDDGDGEGREGRCEIRMIMSESNLGLARPPVSLPPSQAGLLFRLDGRTGAAKPVTNVGNQQFRWTADHKSLFPDDFPDSNPYGVLLIRDRRKDRLRTFVADAGANTISEVMPSGRSRVIAYIPNDPVRDSTPTCVAEGPDGMLYVGTLDLVFNLFVPGGPNRSSVWRVDPNANFGSGPKPTVWATGLTTITACTFDRSGNFWATEMFQPNGAAQPPGDIVRIPFRTPTNHTRIGGGKLPVPGGIAQGRDGAMYVTVGSADTTPNAGAVVRVSH
ncbi:MAG TPA: ScyD/ScyE family protein [Intrasporangium sp.]|uniref:ScyD/ScyE family protein n=1 Tax=Intrasporangium sp. TaxID=1925024 RepID=UPI002D77D024|nr:ScyD/ScyE family protein [Intrasporangium sp.]HET7398441.1 ScyD/ScyE family protein [Intrasporangium sp.]